MISITVLLSKKIARLLANSFTSKNNSQFNFCFSYRGVISNSNYFSFSKYFLISLFLFLLSKFSNFNSKSNYH